MPSKPIMHDRFLRTGLLNPKALAPFEPIMYDRFFYSFFLKLKGLAISNRSFMIGLSGAPIHSSAFIIVLPSLAAGVTADGYGS